jgi:hypothetical protein
MQQEQRAGMKRDRKTRRRSQDGIALLIAIFVLLLISVVAIALLVSSGTETALGANYRTSSTVYYAAIAGLEEARGRLLPKNPNYFGTSVISPSTTFPLGQTLYVINRLSGDNIAPWDSSNTYYDNEYQTEFGVQASSASWQSVYSVWDYSNSPTIPGPIYKWVRINAATEQSLFLLVNANGSSYDNSTPIYYDPFHLHSGNPWPSLVVGSTPTAVQALEVTAMAELPGGSKKILQYLVAPISLDLSPIAPSQHFTAAITLDGNNVVYQGPTSSNFKIVGDDVTTGRTCSAPTLPSVPAIGYTNSSDSSQANITGGTSAHPGNYVGDQPPLAPSPAPSMSPVSLPSSYQSPTSLDSFAQKIIANADVIIPSGPPPLPPYTAHGSDLPSAMAPANPLIVVVQGNLDLTGWHNAGYGILLVTGNLNYDPDASWNGIVLVIGQGTVTGSRTGAGQFNGALFAAQTRDPSTWSLLTGPNLGPASVDFSLSPAMGGNGIRFDSCAISAALTPLTYKVLSFHEIRQ